MLFVNDSDKRVTQKDGEGRPLKKPTPSDVDIRRSGLGRVTCKVGDTVEIPDMYAHPRRADNGDRLASAIENLAPQLRPADAKAYAAWQKAPAPVQAYRRKMGEPTEIPSLEDLLAKGYSPGAARSYILKMQAERDFANGDDEDEDDGDDDKDDAKE